MDRPIVFTAESVQAILAGRKTQTRRVINPQPNFCGNAPSLDAVWYPNTTNRNAKHYSSEAHLRKGLAIDFSPHHPGNRLWVREAWQGWVCYSTMYDEWEEWETGDEMHPRPDSIEYKATSDSCPKRWRSPLHMPRWASRITLEVTDVRVERVQEITRDDALAEGVDLSMEMFAGVNATDKALRRFPKLWDSINAKRGYPWSSNPWVWVIEFEKV